MTDCPDLDRAPLRTYLVLSENRVLTEIEALHTKIAEKQRELRPLERELYEVRKAKLDSGRDGTAGRRNSG